MIKFRVSPNYTYFSPVNDETIQLIDGLTSFRPARYYFFEKYRMGLWDGWFRFRKRDKIPTGLLFSLIIPHMKRNGIEYEIELTYHNLPISGELELNNVDLRDYQLSAINDILAARRGILQLPTNAGKTEIACAVIKAFDKPFLFVTHLKELFYQAYDRIEDRLGIRAGLIGDGRSDYMATGNVAMVQSLSRSPLQKDLLDAPVLIVDEVHHYRGDSPWFDTLMRSNAVVRIGLSATPFKNDEIGDWQVVCLTGMIFGDITNKFLIEEGYSARPEIRVVKIFNVSHFGIMPNRAGKSNYRIDYETMLNSYPRNLVIKKIVDRHKDDHVLVLVDEIEHGKNIMDQLGEDAVFLCGSDTTVKRQQVISDFKNGKLTTLVTTLLGEGVDIPCIEVLVFAAPMKAQHRVIQRLGRGERKAKGKDKVIVYDLVDEWSKYFRNQFSERLKVYKDKDKGVILKYEEET